MKVSKLEQNKCDLCIQLYYEIILRRGMKHQSRYMIPHHNHWYHFLVLSIEYLI